jgi:signal transduction histidine kinase
MKNDKPDVVTQEPPKGRILIVDDDEDFCLSLIDILEQRDYQVEIAHSAPSALEKVKDFDAQVALLDIRLGRESGIDLITPLQNTCPGILCVVMTAYAAVDTAIEAMHRGAYDYLQKPTSVQHLLSVLDRCLERLWLESEKAAAEDTLRRRNRELALLNRAGRELAATLDLQQVTEQLLWEVTRTIGAEGASVWLWDDEDKGGLVCQTVFHQGLANSLINLRVPADEGIVGNVAQQGESIIVTSTPDDPFFSPAIDAQTGFQTTSLLAVPLRARGKVIGVLEAVNKLDGDFDMDDMTLVETLAASAAIAIDNAQLVEALRERTIELQARSEELDAYAHTVAHDLKGPLGHMVGFADVLAQDYAELPGKELSRYLRTIARSGRKMSNIIDELLLLAGLRDVQVNMEPLDMAYIVHQVLERLGYMIEEYQAQVSLPPAGAWPVAWGYGSWVEEVWVNYLSNALKYGGQPPCVELGATQLADQPMIRFWVRDNGPGLTPEEQNRLFTPFTRLDQTRAKGHGLGLSIVQRIVTKLEGEVGVESEITMGSTFWFTLPAQSDSK